MSRAETVAYAFLTRGIGCARPMLAAFIAEVHDEPVRFKRRRRVICLLVLAVHRERGMCGSLGISAALRPTSLLAGHRGSSKRSAPRCSSPAPNLSAQDRDERPRVCAQDALEAHPLATPLPADALLLRVQRQHQPRSSPRLPGTTSEAPEVQRGRRVASARPHYEYAAFGTPITRSRPSCRDRLRRRRL